MIDPESGEPMVAPSICVKNLLLNLVEFDVMVIPMASSMHSAVIYINFLIGLKESFQKMYTFTSLPFVVSDLQFIKVKCVVKQ